MFRSSGMHELYTKWPRGSARRPRLRVRGGKVFAFELSGTHELHTVVCTVEYIQYSINWQRREGE